MGGYNFFSLLLAASALKYQKQNTKSEAPTDVTFLPICLVIISIKSTTHCLETIVVESRDVALNPILLNITHGALSSFLPPKRPPPRTPNRLLASKPRVKGLDVVLDTNEDPINKKVVKILIMISNK
jgi:hypothetical protein